MSPTTILFLLRLVSAGTLLAFLGLIFWYLYQDLKAARYLRGRQSASFGMLRVLSNTSSSPAIDTLLDLAPVTSIGRDNRNTIVLDDNYVSGEHALLAWRESQWWLEDLHSRNGTLLNGVALTDPVVISAGDVITLGDIRFKLELPGRQEVEPYQSGIRDSNP